MGTTGAKPSPRRQATSVVWNGTMKIFGGRDENTSPNGVWSLDLKTYVWTELITTGTKPSGRYGHTSSLSGDKMIVFGGRNSDNPNGMNDVWILDLSSNGWAKQTTTGTKPAIRADCTSVVYHGQMLIFGGYGSRAFHPDTWALDLSTYAWTKLSTKLLYADGSTNRNGMPRLVSATAIVSSGKMVVYGGQNNYRGSVYALDLSTYEWRE